MLHGMWGVFFFLLKYEVLSILSFCLSLSLYGIKCFVLTHWIKDGIFKIDFIFVDKTFLTTMDVYSIRIVYFSIYIGCRNPEQTQNSTKMENKTHANTAVCFICFVLSLFFYHVVRGQIHCSIHQFYDFDVFTFYSVYTAH